MNDSGDEMHWSLWWHDLVPSRHPFDPELARKVIATEVEGELARVHGKASAITDDDRWLLLKQICRRLVLEFGAWTDGWTWVSEEQGGPIRSVSGGLNRYVFERGEKGAQPTIDRLVAPLLEWRAYLEAIEAVFDELPHSEGRRPNEIERDIEMAGARILPIVLQGTEAYRTWYDTFSRAMTWYLEAKGHDPQLLANTVGAVVMGRFESWVAPTGDDEAACFSELGSRVLLEESRAYENENESGNGPKDALQNWLQRSRPAIARFRPIVGHKHDLPIPYDAQRRFVDDYDRKRDPARADAMEVALDLCRESASKPLTFDLLRQWQEVVLGKPAPLRTTDAFAKKGRERYGTPKNLLEQLEACLAQADDTSEPISMRAARVYLDVLFFHPFEDGNARSARLALDHTLSRAGLALQTVEPVFILARSAYDERGPVMLATFLQDLLGKPVR
jgi:hypothetical protein